MIKDTDKIKRERHQGYAANLDILLAMLPLLIMAVYMYGIRPLVMAVIALITANLCDRLVALLRRQNYDGTENSSLVIAGILVLLMPAAIDYYVIIIAVCAAVLVGKHLFGGYGAYPFNPAALGYVVAVVSWPKKMFAYTTPFTSVSVLNASKTAIYANSSPASTLQLGGLPSINATNLLLGNYAGGIGATATLVIVSCFVLLLVRKRVSVITPLVFLATCAAIAFIFPRVQAPRLDVMKYELLSCTLIYGAVFLLSDITTMPKNRISRIVYGVALGIATMMFRYYGSFEMGMCFAILGVNSISGYLDRLVAKISGKRILVKTENIKDKPLTEIKSQTEPQNG